MNIKYKYPQVVRVEDGRAVHCLRCRGYQWEFVGQNCVERFYDGGELDGEPFEECGDLYRCIGCTHVMELHEGLPGYAGPERV